EPLVSSKSAGPLPPSFVTQPPPSSKGLCLRKAPLPETNRMMAGPRMPTPEEPEKESIAKTAAKQEAKLLLQQKHKFSRGQNKFMAKYGLGTSHDLFAPTPDHF
ncbi:hypothetical protein CYMTET_23884, partial [Cymbomonas tetramitiformis]